MTTPSADPQTAVQPPSTQPAPPAPPPPPGVDGTARSILGEDQSRTPTLELRQGVVNAVNLATARCTVTLGGGDTAIPNVAYLSNYKPATGDTCWVLVNGPDLLALDRDGTFGSSAFTGLQSATVDAAQSRSSKSYGDLSTFGPQVVTTVPASGRLLVQVSAYLIGAVDEQHGGGAMSFQMSGANTLSASDRNSVATYGGIGWINGSPGYQGLITVEASASRVILFTDLNPGLTTLTAKYRMSDGSDAEQEFQYRTLWVLPL